MARKARDPWRWGYAIGSVSVEEREALQALVAGVKRQLARRDEGGHLAGDARVGLEILDRLVCQAHRQRERVCDAKGEVDGRVVRCRLILNHADDHRCGRATWRDTEGPRTWRFSCTVTDASGIATGSGMTQREAYEEAIRAYTLDVGHPPGREGTTVKMVPREAIG